MARDVSDEYANHITRDSPVDDVAYRRSQFCAAGINCWLDRTGYRHLSTTPRHPRSHGAAENLVRSVKSILLSANPKTLQDLESFKENFLLYYCNPMHASTRESPAMLDEYYPQ